MPYVPGMQTHAAEVLLPGLLVRLAGQGRQLDAPTGALLGARPVPGEGSSGPG